MYPSGIRQRISNHELLLSTGMFSLEPHVAAAIYQTGPSNHLTGPSRQYGGFTFGGGDSGEEVCSAQFQNHDPPAFRGFPGSTFRYRDPSPGDFQGALRDDEVPGEVQILSTKIDDFLEISTTIHFN